MKLRWKESGIVQDLPEEWLDIFPGQLEPVATKVARTAKTTEEK